MINGINFMGSIKPASLKNKSCSSPIAFKGVDSFERSSSALDKSKSYAQSKIIDVLKQENVEYSFTIGPDGTILHENKGDEGSCSLDSSKVVKGSVLMHGHPVPLPLSSGDIASLLATDAISDEAITVDGKYSRLIKNQSFKSDKNYQELYYQLEQQLCLKVLDKLGIDYEFNSDDLIDMFKDYMSASMFKEKDSISDEDATKLMPLLDISCDSEKLEESRKKLEQMISMQKPITPHQYDKKHNAIIQNYPMIQDILNSDEGVHIRHEFCRDVAKQYNMTYETTLE